MYRGVSRRQVLASAMPQAVSFSASVLISRSVTHCGPAKRACFPNPRVRPPSGQPGGAQPPVYYRSAEQRPRFVSRSLANSNPARMRQRQDAIFWSPLHAGHVYENTTKLLPAFQTLLSSKHQLCITHRVRCQGNRPSGHLFSKCPETQPATSQPGAVTEIRFGGKCLCSVT